jgi:hypothetical protein
MAQRARKVIYCYINIAARAGQGAKILGALKDAGINLLAFSGFPTGGGKAQLDLVADKMAPIRKVARDNGWRVSKTKKGFLVQGDDQVGACLRPLQKLADQKINVVAADGIAAGKGRFGMILWVKPKDYRRAANALNAK